MTLTNPTIASPLNELTSPFGIRVSGQLVGATVSVFASPNFLVARDIARASDQRFMLLSGVRLERSMQLYAMQELGPDTSVAPTGGDNFVGVHPEPQRAEEVGSLVFKSRLFECGRFLWVVGAIPGAMVEIIARSGTLGSGPSLEDGARIALDVPVPHQGAVFARQIVGTFPPGVSLPQPVAPIPLFRDGRGLLPPTVTQPVLGCAASIFVSDVYDGALLHLESVSTAGTVVDIEEAGFDLGSLELVLSRPLMEGEQFTVRQEVAVNCERFPITSGAIPVGSVQPVDAPVVATPLCAGAIDVMISNLRGSSKVQIINNGMVFTGQAPPGITSETKIAFRIYSGLEAGTVTATQELCEITSASSNVANVDASHGDIKPCKIVPHLYDCAQSVSVTNIHAPSLLQVCEVINDELFAISPPVPVFEIQHVIDVSTLLYTSQVIQIKQWACSNESILSDRVTVEDAPALPIPFPAAPIFPGEKSIEITRTIAGATVELFISQSDQNGGAVQWGGRTVANNIKDTVIDITQDLKTGDRLFALQFLCNDVSSRDPPVVNVVDPAGPRPFYIIGHNPNLIGLVMDSLNAGANGIEPDVNRHTSSNDLYISHGLAGDFAPTLVEYLQQLHEVAVKNPELALVMFDCKTPCCSPGNGLILLTAIREHLTFDLSLNIILSVASLGDTSMFEIIYPILRSREGLQVDEHDDVVAVANYFSGRGIRNSCFGYGNRIQSPITSPDIRPNIEEACALKGGENRFKWVYEWVNNDKDRQREFIRTGVDGMIADTVIDLPGIPTVPSDGLENLHAVALEPEFSSLIRIATRADNLYKPQDACYALGVHTGDVTFAATDANITYKLIGTLGDAVKVVDASLLGTYSRNQWDYVTIQSRDIGPLTSITVFTDGSGLGSGWNLDKIQIRSWRYGVSEDVSFSAWVDTTPIVKPL